MKVHFGKAGKSHRRGGRTLAPHNPPGETSPNPAQSRSRRWQCLHPERRGRRKASGGGGREERPGHETKSPSRWPRSRREPFSAAAADESRAPRRLRDGRAGPRRAALGVPVAGGHGRRERPPAACPRLLRRGSPLAGRSPSLCGLALASAPLPCPGPRAPLRVPDRPAAGAPPASGASATPGHSAAALQPPPPPSGVAGVTASQNRSAAAHPRPPPAGRARRSLRADILPPTPRPPRLCLWIVGEENRCMSAPPSARPRPARRRPGSGGVLGSARDGSARGREGLAAAALDRVAPAPRTVARAQGAGMG